VYPGYCFQGYYDVVVWAELVPGLEKAFTVSKEGQIYDDKNVHLLSTEEKLQIIEAAQAYRKSGNAN